jgi:hypothetical protein
MEAPPNTLDFLILGYAVFFVVMGVYLASLAIRFRNLKRDLDILQEEQPQ